MVGYPKLLGNKFKNPQQKKMKTNLGNENTELVAIVGSCGTRLCHAPDASAHAWLMHPKWPPTLPPPTPLAVGQCGQVGVVELFIIFFAQSSLSLSLSLPFPSFSTCFCFILFLRLLCFWLVSLFALTPFSFIY